MDNANTHAPIKFREKLAYGAGDFASSMFWKLFSMFLLFFYTDVFGIAAGAVGTMFLVTRIWDSANDPIMGLIADRTKTHWGKFRPYLLFVAVPFAIIGILTFTTPDLSATGKIIYAYVTYTMMMMVYTAVNVPYAALMGVMSTNTVERTSLASYRFLGAFSGGLLITATATYLIEYFGNGLDSAVGYQVTVGIYSVLAAGLFIFTFAGTKERLQPPIERNKLKDDLKDIIKNGPWFIMLAANISFLIFNSLREAAMIFYFRYYVGPQDVIYFGTVGPSVLVSTYMSIWLAANIVGVLFAKPVAKRLGKRQTFFSFMIATTILSFSLYFILPHQVELMFILNFIIGVTTGINLPIIWSMFADIADYSEWKNGRRATGLIFSSSSMSQKFGWTLGGAFSGWILAAFAYEPGVEQSDLSILGIRLLISVFAGIGALLCVICLYYYRLDDNTMKEINTELVKKRNEQNVEEG